MSDNGSSPEMQYLDTAAVAARIGVKPKTIWEYCWRGSMPEPDTIWLGHRLWLPETIDAWRKQRYVRRHLRPMLERREVPRPVRPPTVVRQGARMPAKPRASRKRTSAGALVKPAVSSIAEQDAQRIAAALREDGVTCTTADVMVLVDVAEDELDHGQRLLQQRIRQRISRRNP